MSQTIVITGANRGIGYDMARLWKARGNHVIAVCRSPAEKKGKEDLHDLGIRVLEGYDVSKAEDVAALKEELGDTQVDVLYNNAGMMENETLEEMNFDTMRQQFEVNTLGPLRVTHALLDNMREGSRVGLMTSRMGSVEDNDSGGRYGYRVSKAGLNAAGKSLAVDLKDRGIPVAILHPGFVKTDMTGNNGDITAEQAAHRLVQRMDELNLDNTGTFWHSDGSVLPW
ncbi:SDR family oxidoreductase [Alloalcanivorax gelatiniphagus]|uniref:SDR family oxidoreductase n=1 Tax=Alloalcanivorax gelatiniphagus TaxID=1194167 RepID=A0ABY2XI31_9GAMM|nr:SDR family oxidoreductase [Alloalcanivorax gelatiniphagus]TMW11415.1 SDR family oxidoreductase [Alloalcanivorax gelatiniphagus]|tara:strand:- start:4589 stop:5269 length:681 start_codon:yes stop_codon:yes gene_type:complete